MPPHVFTSKDDVIPANMSPSFFFSFQSERIISSQEVSKKEMDKEVCPPPPSNPQHVTSYVTTVRDESREVTLLGPIELMSVPQVGTRWHV